jgi:hypothetical protein
MTSLTKDIFNFYKVNSNNDYYLIKYFTNTAHVGKYEPYAKDIIPSDETKVEWGTVDEYNTYEINHFGLRGEIDENSDVIASGCSITFGLGVPEEARWTNILSTKINKSVTNLGNLGASVESICNDIVQYCLNTKIPKEIFCLFPDFFRSMIVVDKDFFQSRHLGSSQIRSNLAKDGVLALIYCNPTIRQYEGSLFMETQDKKFIEDSTSPHQLILNSINAIYALESFCSTNNIKLYWTTWDINTHLLMQLLLNIKNFKLKNFIPFFTNETSRQIGGFVNQTCDSDHGSEFANTEFWKRGSDYTMINGVKTHENSHPGIHAHVHVSDLFYKTRN